MSTKTRTKGKTSPKRGKVAANKEKNMCVKSATKNGRDGVVEQEIRKLGQTTKRALKKDTPEHKKIFHTHAKAWKTMANK